MGDFINIFIKSAFIENMILAYFLGMCSFLAVSKSLNTAFGLGLAVIFVLGITMPINWLINEYLLVSFELEFLRFIVFIAVMAGIFYFGRSLNSGGGGGNGAIEAPAAFVAPNIAVD